MDTRNLFVVQYRFVQQNNMASGMNKKCAIFCSVQTLSIVTLKQML